MARFTLGSGSRHAAGREVDRIPEGEELPAEAEKEGYRVAGTVLVVIGSVLLVAGIGVLVVWFLGIGGDLTLGILLTGISAVLLPLALHQIVSHKRWWFTPDEVTHEWRGLFGSGRWTEPLSNYDGILSEAVYHSGGRNSPSYTEYILRLEHSHDKKKRVRLYCSRSREGFRARHERYAQLFGLPALLKTKDGIEARDPEDLDKSVRERVAAGTMEVTFDPSRPPPGRHLRVKVEGDRLVVRTRPGALGKAGVLVPLIFALVGGGLVAAVFIPGLDGPPIVMAVFGGLFGLLGIAGLVFGRTVVQELEIPPAEVRSRWETPFGSVGERGIPAGEIEEVVVRTPEGNQDFTMVQAISDTGTVHFGFGLSEEEQHWVRDCIIAVIAR